MSCSRTNPTEILSTHSYVALFKPSKPHGNFFCQLQKKLYKEGYFEKCFSSLVQLISHKSTTVNILLIWRKHTCFDQMYFHITKFHRNFEFLLSMMCYTFSNQNMLILLIFYRISLWVVFILLTELVYFDILQFKHWTTRSILLVSI